MRFACDLSRWLEQRTAIVTPSALLATAAREQFAREQIAKGAGSWDRPAISSVDAWLRRCWSEARHTAPNIPALLSAAQEHVLWRQTIEQESNELFDPDTAAYLARDAARLMAEWQIPPDAANWGNRDDGQQFRRWLKRFRRRCEENEWIVQADLWRLVPAWVRAPAVSAGFETYTPALKQLLSLPTMERAKAEPRPRGSGTATKCASFEEEIENAARWARVRFEENPAQSIGVFVPGLARQRALVARHFESVFYPSRAAKPAIETADSIFSIHAAAPLAEHPVAAAALLVLELAQERIPLPAASALLRSPFLAGAEAERNQRAMADLHLRRPRPVDVGLRDLERVSEKCPKLRRLWMRVRRVLRDDAAIRELPQWSEFIGKLLRAVRWPGDAELSAEEQEAVEGMQKALSELASLGLVSPPVSFDAALAHLRRLLSAPKDSAGFFAPVQILDSAQASGLACDCAFLTGMSEENWPPPLSLNPLVPLTVQRAQGVPGSSPESAQREKQELTDALLSVAPVIEISAVSSAAAGERQTTKKDGLPYSFLESVDDTYGPKLVLTAEIRGGTSLIKAQSQCPFRAFAENRLHAAGLEEAALGLDSRERGGFLHKALEAVWQELQTQDRLRAATEEELRKAVRRALETAIDGHMQTPFERLAKETERERLEEVILDWLAIEREREQPFAVEAVELKREHEFAGLRLKLRLDRIDRLANGNVLLLDYKSGKQGSPKWDADRPLEPQVQVYAAALGSEVDGLFLCQLKPRDMKAIGHSREKQFTGKSAAVADDWDGFLEQSSACIEKLAGDFAAGFAAVDPLKKACDYCSQKPLCRIQERNAIREDEDD
ncbi:MAG: PD-(D/E)XK nuclease family protein [Bryobacteraceae bacterium]